MNENYVNDLRDNGLIIVTNVIEELEKLKEDDISSFVIGVDKVHKAIPPSNQTFERNAMVPQDPKIKTEFVKPTKVVVGQ